MEGLQLILSRKRPILLLEVMIAIALIVMAAIPLIYPHIYLLRAQRHFMDKVDLDHAVNLHYIDILERLYKNEISWAAVLNELEFSISEEELKKSGYNKPLPFKGSYRFKVQNFKPKGEGGAPLTLYVLDLDYVFHPAKQSPTDENRLRYHYDLFVVRDLGDGNLPQGDPEEEETPEEDEGGQL